MLLFRPHHFLCTYCFKGYGYSNVFIANFINIHNHLDESNPKIKVVSKIDDICKKCPNIINNQKECSKEQMILEIDNMHQRFLDLKSSQIVFWYDIKRKIKENITINIFNKICIKCEWHKLDICYNSLLNNKNL